jgi:ornithine cyclodeaminase
MPAFGPAGDGIVKLSTIFPDNQGRGIPTIQGTVIVFSACGKPIALLDGAAVTKLRTAAASALASTYLSGPASSRLLIIGTGGLAPTMAAAHCAVRPINRVYIWGRRSQAASETAAVVRSLVDVTIEVSAVDSLERAIANADIISCATSSTEPILCGRLLRPGTFVDLVGSFSATAREADDDAILRSRVFVDTLDGSMSEAGDLLDPIKRGIINREHILGELADLIRGRVLGRAQEDDITLFKSVGTAIEDLALANLIVETVAAH